MKYMLILVAILVVADIAFEAARFYHHLRVSSGLVAIARPYERTDGTRSMLVIGDSTAVGVGADTPAHTLAGYLSGAFDASVENYAVSGAVTAQMQGQFVQAKKARYDLILIQVGANDVIRFHSIPQTSAMLDTLLKAARQKSDHVVLITAGRIGEAPLFPWFVAPFVTHRAHELRDSFKATADKDGVAYVDLYNIPDPFSADPEKYYAPDGLHLTADGWHFWYEATLQTIETTWPGFVHEQQ
jgi:lysophospholipase L1-like esterase